MHLAWPQCYWEHYVPSPTTSNPTLKVILSGNTLYCYVGANALSMAAVLLGRLCIHPPHHQPHPESNTQW